MRRFIAALVLCACTRMPTVPPADPGAAMPLAFDPEPAQEGLTIELSEGDAPAGAADRPPLADSAALDPTTTRALLDRLPPLAVEPGQVQPFALSEASLPPPRAGETLSQPFPPADDAPPPDPDAAGPLRVLRWAPDGEVPAAPHLSVTFSRPMVAVTTQDEAARTLPLTLSPKPPGTWRWVGTRTLLFQPDGQFPKATDYTVSAPGLDEPFSARFSTPAPGLGTQHPQGGPVRRDPVIVLGFDQRIDPAAVAAHVRARAGDADLVLRLATSDEIHADAEARRVVERLQAGRWLALVPAEPLPYDANVRVLVEPGTPSAEGPRTTRAQQMFAFKTFGPFLVTGTRCGWRDRCAPGDTWQVELSNPVDVDRFDPDQVEVEPAVELASVSVSGSRVLIQARAAPETTYTVRLGRDLVDRWGQALTGDDRARFAVGPREPQDPWLAGFPGTMVVLDPAAPPNLSLYSGNHPTLRARAWAVGPADWDAWQAWNRDRLASPQPFAREPVLDRTLDVAVVPNETVETTLALDEALREGKGQLVVLVEPTRQPADSWRRQQAAAWVQVTKLGVDAFQDGEELLVWVTRLADGEPVPGAAVRLGTTEVETDSTGLARMALPEEPEDTRVIVVRHGDDAAFLVEDTSWWGDGGTFTRPWIQDELRWLVFDDRKMYRPGESVSVKGLVRRYQAGRGGDIASAGVESVGWTLVDSRGNEILAGSAPVGRAGGFDLTVALPSTMNLGTARLDLAASVGGLAGATHHHTFQVQEFRRPEFEVSVSAEAGPHVLGQTALATVQASYYAGGPLPGAPATWRVTATPSSFTPPGWSEYRFGQDIPWWYRSFWRAPSEPTRAWALDGSTDATGAHHLAVHFAALKPARPYSVEAQGTVRDVNRQAWTGSTTFVVHPSRVYLGLRPARPFTEQGAPVKVSVVVVDIDGGVVPGLSARVDMVRYAWAVAKDGTWSEKEVERQSCALSSAKAPQDCTFQPKEGGRFELVGTVTDPQGRPNETRTVVWVSGGQAKATRKVVEEDVLLIPDAETYQPGQVARVLVQAPFAPAEALVTWRRSGIVHAERLTMDGASATVEVPITEEHVPNLHLRVDLVGSAPRSGVLGEPRTDLARRPAFASGSLNLPVPPLSRTLTVTARPREAALAPGGETVIDVEVTDASGRPAAGAEVAVVVADESVLALTGYRVPDPVGVFYTERPEGTEDTRSRAWVWLADPEALGQAGAALGSGSAPTTGAIPPPAPAAFAGAAPEPEPRALGRGRNGGGQEGGGTAIVLRTDFNPLALFAPAVQTDAAGRATVPLKLPDNLTRYRVVAVAAWGDRHMGKGESTVTARKPLMLRPSPPRFLNFGDLFELPFVVQNQTDRPLTVDLAVRGTNLLLDGQAEAGRRATVPAGDRVEVRIPAATAAAGSARLQAAVAAGDAADAASFELKVWTPATSEAFATTGSLGGQDGTTLVLAQPVRAPEAVWPQFGGLEITTSSTQLQALTDAVIYLVDYPFSCAEQLASRVLAIAALRDALAAFDAEGLPDPAALQARVDADLAELGRRQNPDGGFGFWRAGQTSWPFVSVHAAHALARARLAGFALPEGTWEGASRYLAGIEQAVPKDWSPQLRWTVTAYAVHVRHVAGEPADAAALALLREAGLEALPLEALGWLLPALHAGGHTREVQTILRHLDNRVSETASTAQFTTSYGDEGYLLLHSSRRADGVLLEALLDVRPQDDLLPKLVAGLLSHRVRGRWSSTQDNAFVLLALDRYFHTFEGTDPDFVARAWLGQDYAGEHAFRGRTTERVTTRVPMAWLAERGTQDLLLTREGAGRLYYRLALSYAPRDLDLAPADHGFAVERVYEAVDDPAQVRRDDDGTWHVAAGARVRVRLTMVAPARRTHVALTDPLPAGLEVMNPELAVTGDVPADPPGRDQPFWWWWRPWYEHENLRDERVEAFTTLLWDGVHSYTYVARATTPGTFVVPPARAEEMYAPETFGRSGTDRVVVE